MDIHGPGHILHRLHHIGKLAHAGGLNQDPIRCVGIQNLLQCGSKVAHQGAADASGVHLIHLDAGILQETAVDTDLSEFIFNQYNFLTLKSLFQKLFNQCCLSGSQKAGDNGNLCHFSSFFLTL